MESRNLRKISAPKKQSNIDPTQNLQYGKRKAPIKERNKDSKIKKNKPEIFVGKYKTPRSDFFYCNHQYQVMSCQLSSIDEELSLELSSYYKTFKFEDCRKREKGCEPELEKQGRKTKIRQEYLDFLYNFLSNPKNGMTSLYSLRNLLLRRFSLLENSIDIGTVAKMIKKINFSWKRSKKMLMARNTSDTKTERSKAIKSILNYRRQGKTFIYWDENGFSNFLIPISGYSLRGKPFTAQTPPREPRLSVLAAITDKGVLAYQIFQVSVKGADFACFLINLIKNHDMQAKGLNNFVLFIDNAKIHVAKYWKKLRNYLHVCFNAPYSPFFNPIEEVFGLWKHHFRIDKPTNSSDMPTHIIKSCHKIGERQTVGVVKHSIQYKMDCLNESSID